jgi:hypothetical protein
VVTSSLAILKGFYYAEMNLPRRLQELLDDSRNRHLHDRPQLLGYVQGQFDKKDFLVPTILANPLAQVLQIFGWQSIRTRARDVATSVDRLSDEFKNVATWKADTENRKVTAHLLRGTFPGAQANENQLDSFERKKLLELSLHEFEEAIALRASDLDALEGAVQQAGALGDLPKQLGVLNEFIRCTEGDRMREKVFSRL